MPKERTFEIRAEAACCIWEHFNELRLSKEMMTKAYHNSPILEQVNNFWDNWGSSQMRHTAINLADLCCDVYDHLGQNTIEDMGLHSFDWEFVPMFLECLIWKEWPLFHQSKEWPLFHQSVESIAAKIAVTAAMQQTDDDHREVESEAEADDYLDDASFIEPEDPLPATQHR